MNENQNSKWRRSNSEKTDKKQKIHILNIRYCRDGWCVSQCHSYYLIMLCVTFNALPPMLPFYWIFMEKKESKSEVATYIKALRNGAINAGMKLNGRQKKNLQKTQLKRLRAHLTLNSQICPIHAGFDSLIRFRHKRNFSQAASRKYRTCMAWSHLNQLKMPHFRHSWHHWTEMLTASMKIKQKHKTQKRGQMKKKRAKWVGIDFQLIAPSASILPINKYRELFLYFYRCSMSSHVLAVPLHRWCAWNRRSYNRVVPNRVVPTCLRT